MMVRTRVEAQPVKGSSENRALYGYGKEVEIMPMQILAIDEIGRIFKKILYEFCRYFQILGLT